MTETEVNIPLLRKAVEWAEAEAARPFEVTEWLQTSWVTTPLTRAKGLAERDYDYGSPEWMAEAERLLPECGTAYCIAGFVAQSIDSAYASSHVPNDKMHVAEFAAKALGIDPPECNWGPQEGHLFHTTNTVADVRRIAEDIAGERL